MAYVGRREGRKSRRSPNHRWDVRIIMDGKRTLSGWGLNLADSRVGSIREIFELCNESPGFINSVIFFCATVISSRSGLFSWRKTLCNCELVCNFLN